MKKHHIFPGLRSFLILWSSQTVSALGTAMTNYALSVWVFGQEGTASSLTMLTLCSFLPTIFFRFIAGAIADSWDKKRIMLVSDLLAACGTAAVLVLHSVSALRIWHLYCINFLLSIMNAFQTPASYVATSLLVPKEQYARVGGLQAFSGSAVSILAPALGSVLFAFGGLEIVLAIDLISFAIAFASLLLFIRIPAEESSARAVGESFVKRCTEGIRFLREHSPLLRLILFFAVINFLAKLGCDGMMTAFVLSRTGGDQSALGIVQTAVSLGIMGGSILVTLTRPPRNRIKLIFCTCGLTFLFGLGMSFTRSPAAWASMQFAVYMSAAVMNAHLTALMRDCVPVGMQGRVFSARDTLQNCTIPLGLFLGGVLADHVFEPFMSVSSPLQRALSAMFGAGAGSGIALMFFIVSIAGTLMSFIHMNAPVYQELDKAHPSADDASA